MFLAQTFASKSGVLRHDIHYWLGKDTSQVNLCCHEFILLSASNRLNLETEKEEALDQFCDRKSFNIG